MFKKILLGIAIIAIAIFAYIKFKVYQINNAPQEFSYEQFSKPTGGTEEYITTPDGSVLRTTSAGTGPTVVLAHGFGGTIRDWNMIFEQLIKDGFHVIAFEQRGHYKSKAGKDGINSKAMVSDYVAILEHFKVENAVLVGHSMGGFLSIRFMLDYPEIAKRHLKAAVIMSSFAGDISKDNGQNKIQIPMIKNGMINSIFENQTLATLFSAALVGKPNKAIIQTSLDNFKLQNYSSLVPILEAFSNENYYPRLKEIGIPCTILVGTADKTAPTFHSEDLAKNIPTATLIKIEGRGHLLNWEAPKEVAEVIEKVAR
jgi:non-heme chloroperoxidase